MGVCEERACGTATFIRCAAIGAAGHTSCLMGKHRALRSTNATSSYCLFLYDLVVRVAATWVA